MINKRVPFLAYRYLVTNQSIQTTLIQQINKSYILTKQCYIISQLDRAI